MSDLEILKRYVAIADMTDLRFLATEYALEQNWECLDIVTDEIERRDYEDKKQTQKIVSDIRPDDELSKTKIMASVKSKHEDSV